MNLPTPFAYPAAAHVRRHGPQGYKNYGDYKPFLRDEFTFRCVYCLEREVWYPNRDGSFSADHFVPKAINPGLETDCENLVYACVHCNHHKGPNLTGLDPRTKKLTRLFHPRRHKWDCHFQWDDALLIGRTAVGRTTVAVLGINLPLRVRLREELIEEGLFP